MEGFMEAFGDFEVQLEAQTDEQAPVGRMLITKQYSGSLVGAGLGQMLSKRTATGSAVYTAIEEFDGSLDGKKGAFTLVHMGRMSETEQSLQVEILEGSGSGELEGISGKMAIIRDDGRHTYELEYTL
jgi:hypothetical protein